MTMKILILEDDFDKKNKIIQVIKDLKIEYVCCEYFSDFIGEINREKFNLVVADLIVPVFKDSLDTDNITSRLIENIRDPRCCNFSTPVIAITQFDKVAEEGFRDLNNVDIMVVTYEDNSVSWTRSLTQKINICIPEVTYDFVIVCALDKEAEAYSTCGYKIGNYFSIHGISCRSIEISSKKGLIITPTRMGLVNSAILCSRAIDLFKPKLICMSGICAGIEGKAKIYDIVIPEICHQHDSGKWTSDGFIPEFYSVQLKHETKLLINEIIKQKSFIREIKKHITLTDSESNLDTNDLEFEVYMAPTSSGSAVIADESRLQDVRNQHRKSTAFEMESYALYESARQSLIEPIFFSAKCVVDNGDSNKGDQYHRVACLLSAKAVYEIIKRGIII